MTSPSHGEDLVFESRRAHAFLIQTPTIFLVKIPIRIWTDKLFLYKTNRILPMQITPSIHAIRHSFRVPVAPGIALDRDRVLSGIGFHYKGCLVCDQLIVENPGEKMGRYGVLMITWAFVLSLTSC